MILLLVAFTSVLGNYSYGEANMNFLTKTRGWHLAFGWAVTLMVFVGAVISVDLAWSIAGVSMVVIAAVNLVVIALLGKPALKLLRHYQAEVKAGPRSGLPGLRSARDRQRGMLGGGGRQRCSRYPPQGRGTRGQSTV